MTVTDSPMQLLIGYISRNQYQVGQRLPSIRELATEFSVGPHAVRDVLLQAQTYGIVEVRPRSGAYVQSVDLSVLATALGTVMPYSLPTTDANLLDLLEARRVIESESTSLAALRRRMADLVPVRHALDAMYQNVEDYHAYVQHNEAFHLRISEITGNTVLLMVLKHLMEMLRAVLVERQPASWVETDSRKRSIDMTEHEAIFNALVAGDPVAAKTAMLAHLRDTTDSLVPPNKR